MDVNKVFVLKVNEANILLKFIKTPVKLCLKNFRTSQFKRQNIKFVSGPHELNMFVVKIYPDMSKICRDNKNTVFMVVDP